MIDIHQFHVYNATESTESYHSGTLSNNVAPSGFTYSAVSLVCYDFERQLNM